MTDEKPATSNVLVELHVPDFKKVKEFYGKLGFGVVWERPPEGFKGYLILRMEDNILCFWAGNEHVYKQEYFSQFPKDSKRGYGVELVLMVEDIETYYQLMKDKVKIFEDLRDRPWGLRDFRLEDPFGYYLRITSKHNILDNKYAVK
jgi:catechol 2,3-dioxygenase-like lactoylglutathione lyase family enzyme